MTTPTRGTDEPHQVVFYRGAKAITELFGVCASPIRRYLINISGDVAGG